MNKKDYLTNHTEVADLLKNGLKDAHKLDELDLKSFNAWKEYHKLNDKRLKFFKKKKYYQAAKLQNKCLRLLIKAQKADNEYQKAQIDLADMRKVYAKAKKKENKSY